MPNERICSRSVVDPYTVPSKLYSVKEIVSEQTMIASSKILAAIEDHSVRVCRISSIDGTKIKVNLSSGLLRISIC